MFGLLSSSQIYGLQQAHEQHNSYSNINAKSKSNSLPYNKQTQSQQHQQQNQHRRSSSSLSDTAAGNKSESGSKFFATLSVKSPTNFIEKFIKTELLSGYDTLKNYKNYQQHSTQASTGATGGGETTSTAGSNTKSATFYSNLPTESILNGFNCLQGSYRSNCDGEFYEAVNLKTTTPTPTPTSTSTTNTRNTTNSNSYSSKSPDMTIRCSKNLLADTPQSQSPATLQNYQKLPEYEHDLLVVPPLPQAESGSSSISSGASSGEFNTDSAGHTPASNLYKKLSFGARLAKHGGNSSGGSSVGGGIQQIGNNQQCNDMHSDNSSSSLSTSTTARTQKSSEVQRSSSDSSTTDGIPTTVGIPTGSAGNQGTPERAQRRKLLQMISNYEQHNKLLQRELAKEKRRRTEELACVVKSLICFESKLKTDMKVVNQRLYDKDVEICRLVRQNRALKKRIGKMELEKNARDDEGVVQDREDEEGDESNPENEVETTIDCLLLEALQCINCRKQFYDIELKENATQTPPAACATGAAQVGGECGGRSNNDLHHLHHHSREQHGSSSDDTVSSSFYGARRSVRYTSKRTSGTFRDYMRSRSLNIDDPSLEQNSEENTSTISREDSQTTSSYEQLHNYSRHMERMHGVKPGANNDSRSGSRLSHKSGSGSASGNSKVSTPAPQLEEDDGIFSPTQDDEDFDEYDDIDLDADEAQLMARGAIKIVARRSTEFSEASPKQIYETSTDDWYASASDQEDMTAGPTTKSYGHGAVNPVLECVNQILLQQSMEETVPETPKPIDISKGSLPRRSSLSGRRCAAAAEDADAKQLGTGGPGGVAGGNTFTRKRVHFSTKNSMVHVPRHDNDSDEEDVMPTRETALISHYHPMSPSATVNVAASTALPTTPETLNYESIYSNEYEPIGSERTSNLYVDMEATSKCNSSNNPLVPTSGDKLNASKLPPALPPKPANLLKFKKSLQQLEEVSDEQEQASVVAPPAPLSVTSTTEPDYCSISEVNGVTGMQIIADIHKAPPSNASTVAASELELEVSTVASDDTFDASQKTETEIEEIFADIPKLPNVAAIIAPKQLKYQASQAGDYLTMTATTTITSTPTRVSGSNSGASGTCTTLVESKLAQTLKLPLTPTTPTHTQYKRKHVPHILVEINKRMSLPSGNSPVSSATTPTNNKSRTLPANKAPTTYTDNSPLQAEFDWYNLDAEYGKAPQHHHSSTPNDGGGMMLAEIQEDSECLAHAADEYNLDEEFKLPTEEQEQETHSLMPIYSENSPMVTDANDNNDAPLLASHLPGTKAKKMKKNLANFEKFIEGSGLSTKPLPSKRKIYFSGPFV